MRARDVVRLATALLAAGVMIGCWTHPDSVSGASLRVTAGAAQGGGILPGKPVVVTPSDKGGAAKLASVMAARLGAHVISPTAATAEELETAGLIGFGSGIFDQAHHKALLNLAEALPAAHGRKAFIFSTRGVSRRQAPSFHAEDPHKALRERLLAKGFEIVGEFNCAGYNDNSFLILFVGMNKGHPDAGDIGRAEAFADSLLEGGAG